MSNKVHNLDESQDNDGNNLPFWAFLIMRVSKVYLRHFQSTVSLALNKETTKGSPKASFYPENNEQKYSLVTI